MSVVTPLAPPAPIHDESVHPRIREYADQTVEYVRRALGVALEFDSNTLPLLDHYLRTVPADQPATAKLVVITAGAYFGEVARRLLGGRWEMTGTETDWRLVLPTGLNFSPSGFVASAIAQADLEEVDTEIEAPARMKPYVQQALARMGEVTEQEYYSLCGRLDTLEHLHEVLVAVAAQMLGSGADEDAAVDDSPEAVAAREAVIAAEAAEAAAEAAPQPVVDDPSDAVN